MLGAMQFGDGKGNALFLTPPIQEKPVSNEEIADVVKSVVAQVKGRKDKDTVIKLPAGWTILEKERPFVVGVPDAQEAQEPSQLYQPGYEQQAAPANAIVLDVGELPNQYRQLIFQFTEAVTAAARAGLTIGFEIAMKSAKV